MGAELGSSFTSSDSDDVRRAEHHGHPASTERDRPRDGGHGAGFLHFPRIPTASALFLEPFAVRQASRKVDRVSRIGR